MAGCKEKKVDAKMTDDSGTSIIEKKPAILQEGCYSFDADGNMVSFEITDAGDAVLGNLSYAYSGKDNNTGTFKGQLEKDKLIGNYTFLSEGRESIRQVAFQVKGNQLIEGYGELNEDGTTFKNTNTINYSSNMPLTKTDCHK
jgi:hypothetical protein